MRAVSLLLVAAAVLLFVLAGIKASNRPDPEPELEDLGPLASIFVCITFAWQVEKLAFLQLVRHGAAEHPTTG